MQTAIRITTITCIIAFCFAACAQPDESTESGTASPQVTPSPGVMLVEHWRCPVENIPLLDQHADSIWTPIFRELVSEGRFLAFGRLVPPSESEWNWMSYWMTESDEAMDAAWGEFGDRLRAKFPDDPRPTALCDTLVTVQYVVTHESRFAGSQ